MDAVILGGAENSGALKNADSSRYEAGIRINGRPMVEYVISALEKVEEIERIVVVAPEDLVVASQNHSKLIAVAPGESMVDSLLQGLKALDTNRQVLVLTSDIPLITAEALKDFLSACRKREADLYYSFVPKTAVEERYQGVSRTYVHLKDGVFTGGNVMLVDPQVILSHWRRIFQAVQLRKEPLKLCRLFGYRFFLKLVCGQLTVAEIEGRVEEILKIKGAGIVSFFPEIGIDVDKPSDLELAQALLS